MKLPIASASAFCFGDIDRELSTTNRMSTSCLARVLTGRGSILPKHFERRSICSAAVLPGGIGHDAVRSGAVHPETESVSTDVAKARDSVERFIGFSLPLENTENIAEAFSVTSSRCPRSCSVWSVYFVPIVTKTLQRPLDANPDFPTGRKDYFFAYLGTVIFYAQRVMFVGEFRSLRTNSLQSNRHPLFSPFSAHGYRTSGFVQHKRDYQKRPFFLPFWRPCFQ